MKPGFLPINRDESAAGRAKEVDVVIITGDAYVDHPSFGAAVIARVLEARGYRVGIIARPAWKDAESITVFGRPRLFFGITSGNVDSMVSRYTSFKRLRSDDPYAPGGRAGDRPERAVIVYANLVRRIYKDVPIVIGGIEASMRRAAHYDFWTNKLRRSIIEDCRADILVYGMGEKQAEEIADRIASGRPLHGIPGTVTIEKEAPKGALLLPRQEEVMGSKKTFSEFYRLFYRHQQSLQAQPTGKRFLVHSPYYTDIDSRDLDRIYELPFMRQPHPAYREKIPAFEMICASISAHRGCVSGCSFCSLALHQGKKIISRSRASIGREVDIIASKKYFKGQITDVGGPSANMYGFTCKVQWRCARESCLFPALCPNLEMKTWKWLELLKMIARKKNVSKVTIGSGIRYDLLMHTPDRDLVLKSFIQHHISGQLKIAPEHTSAAVLRAMRKVPLSDLQEFVRLFQRLNRESDKKQYLVPYLMSCHPGGSFDETRKMKNEVFKLFGFVPQQVQAFLPLPMTLSSVIYYTGSDPLTGEKFRVERDMEKRSREHNIFFSR